ncbi:MAG TPA: hypothetical protein VD994_20810 [Prosthecobacter sp.]|nr:hypothetical protein [Prosthecobacter sp.]
MKTFHFFSTIAAVALALPVIAQSERQSSNVSDSGSSSATARQSGATSGSNTSTSAGMAFHNGQPYIIRDSQATMVDRTMFESNKMVTANGEWVEVRDGIAGLNRKTSNVADGGSSSATARQSGAISGSQTGGNNQDGWIMQEGKLYRVENGRATEVDPSAIPSGQMMDVRGRTMAIPTGVNFNARDNRSSGSRDSTSSNSTRNAAEQNRSSSSSAPSGSDARGASGSRSDTNPQR